jgi:hypothetical protein
LGIESIFVWTNQKDIPIEKTQKSTVMLLPITLLVTVLISFSLNRFIAYIKTDRHPGLGALAD